MFTDFLSDIFSNNREKDAIIWQGRTYSYRFLLKTFREWMKQLAESSVSANDVVLLEADFSPNAVALLLALIEHSCIVVPLTASVKAKKEEFCEIAQVENIITIDQEDAVSFDKISRRADHELLRQLKDRGHPGLILFSSGSTGKSKAALHDFVPLLEKFEVSRHAMRTLTFLLFDHIGGINTLFHVFSNAGCVVTVQDRSPDDISRAIETHKVQLLPTSPTFINLMLLSEAYRKYDLSSLELVTYGTEVMPESTLRKFHECFPNVRLLQTYGLSEIGIMRSKSESSDSLWMKIGGEGIKTRIVDNILHIRTPSAMMGYLNAPSPFTPDGWFDTGDTVETNGDYIRILGRESEIINVGGEKVWPAEIEEVIQAMPGVEDVAVIGIKSPITGQMVQAAVKLVTEETLSDFRKRMRTFCKDKLAPFKIPQKVVLADHSFHGGRFKKLRRGD